MIKTLTSLELVYTLGTMKNDWDKCLVYKLLIRSIFWLVRVEKFENDQHDGIGLCLHCI